MLEEKVNSLHILGVYILRTKKKSKEHFQRKNICTQLFAIINFQMALHSCFFFQRIVHLFDLSVLKKK